MLRRTGLLTFAVLALSLAATASAGAQVTDLTGDVAVYSDSGDEVGQGQTHVYTQADALLSIGGSQSYLTVVVDASSGDTWTLTFGAPAGETLAPGIYSGVSGTPGQASVDVSGEGRGCGGGTVGLFQVQDIGTDSTGAVDRLWITFEQSCAGRTPALFGEVRLGEPAGGGSLSPAPALVRWPEHSFGTPETTVPVGFVATAQTTIQSVSLAGADPGQFAIRADGCTKLTLAAGQACTVDLQSRPFAPGTTTATLDVGTSDGQQLAVPLQSWTEGGTTMLRMSSVGGDFVGGDQRYRFVPANATISASGTPELVSFALEGPGAETWSGSFAAPAGGILAAGLSYYRAQRYPIQGTAAGLAISGDGRECTSLTGHFTITDATFSLAGQLETFGVRFAQRCTDPGARGELLGSFDWKAGATTPPPPWGVPPA